MILYRVTNIITQANVKGCCQSSMSELPKDIMKSRLQLQESRTFNSSSITPRAGGIQRYYAPLSPHLIRLRSLFDFLTRHLELFPET